MRDHKTIYIATRRSPLALWQARFVQQALLQLWPQVSIELLPLVTSGDKFLKQRLLALGGKGLFVKELEEALLDKRADFAVHSTKDMPALCPEGLTIAAFCKRDNPLDAFLSIHYPNLDALPPHATIGTASLRRQSQLLAYRKDFQIEPLRGNIHTRLDKLKQGKYDAIILAASGLERMGLTEQVMQILPPEIMLPTCGQGALCIECRTDDERILEMIATLNDSLSALCVSTERSVNAQLGGHCHVPCAVFCTPSPSNQLLLRAKVLSVDGSVCIEDAREGSKEQAALLAQQCVHSLLQRGAATLLATQT